MRISYHGLFGFLQPTADELPIFEQLREDFSILNESRYMVKSFREGFWDGRTYAIDKHGKFLRGLTDQIVGRARQLGAQVEYEPYNAVFKAIDQPLIELADSLDLEGIDLAPHQRRMVRALLKNGGGTVEGVTASGKTESIALLIQILLDVTDTIFFLVHRIQLMTDACERVAERAPDLRRYLGLLGDSKRPYPDTKVFFCTQQSLSIALGLVKGKRTKDAEIATAWKSAGAIIIDECHNVASEAYQKLLGTIGEVPIYGFSGTPETDDPMRDWAVIGVSGPIVTRVKRPELENNGFMAEAIACVREFVFKADEPDRGKKRRRVIDWVPQKEELNYYVDAINVSDSGETRDIKVLIDHKHGIQHADGDYNLFPEYGRDMLFLEEKRNDDIIGFVKASLDDGRYPLILCERIAQAYYLYGLFTRSGEISGESIGVIHGKHSPDERKTIVSAYENGASPVLIASSIFDEGVDLKNVGTVVLASGGASLVRIVQRIGRGVRAKGAQQGNYIPIWFPLDSLTAFSREHTITRVGYLERAEITIEENTEDWFSFFRFLRDKYSKNKTRVA